MKKRDFLENYIITNIATDMIHFFQKECNIVLISVAFDIILNLLLMASICDTL